MDQHTQCGTSELTVQGKSKSTWRPSYGVIARKTWRQPNFQRLTDREKLVLVYLWTCENGKGSAGCFYILPEIVAKDCRISPRSVLQAMRNLEKSAWFEYDPVAGVIFFRKHLQFEIPLGESNIEGYQKVAVDLPDCQLAREYIALLRDWRNNFKDRLAGVKADILGLVADQDQANNRSREGGRGGSRDTTGGGEPDPLPEPDQEPEHLSVSAVADRSAQFKSAPRHSKTTPINPQHKEFKELWLSLYRQHVDPDAAWSAEHGKHLSNLLRAYEGNPAKLRAMVIYFLTEPDTEWVLKSRQTLRQLWWDRERVAQLVMRNGLVGSGNGHSDGIAPEPDESYLRSLTKPLSSTSAADLDGTGFEHLGSGLHGSN